METSYTFWDAQGYTVHQSKANKCDAWLHTSVAGVEKHM